MREIGTETVVEMTAKEIATVRKGGTGETPEETTPVHFTRFLSSGDLTVFC